MNTIPGRTALRLILLANLVSTGLHYWHNYVAIERYPQTATITGSMTQTAILIFWPLLTVTGLIGYVLYVRGRFWGARACLVTYSLAGFATLGHFLVGVPDVPWYWFATIFTDALGGLALWTFAVWSAVVLSPRPSGVG